MSVIVRFFVGLDTVEGGDDAHASDVTVVDVPDGPSAVPHLRLYALLRYDAWARRATHFLALDDDEGPAAGPAAPGKVSLEYRRGCLKISSFRTRGVAIKGVLKSVLKYASILLENTIGNERTFSYKYFKTRLRHDSPILRHV